MTLKSGERWRQLELPCVETCGATWPRRQYHAYVFKAIDFSLTLRIDYTLPCWCLISNRPLACSFE